MTASETGNIAIPRSLHVELDVGIAAFYHPPTEIPVDIPQARTISYFFLVYVSARYKGKVVSLLEVHRLSSSVKCQSISAEEEDDNSAAT